MDYAQVRVLHIGCACISIALFLLRWGLAMQGTSWRRYRWLRVAPHANDSVLLGAAITLVAWSHQWPWQQAWLGAKVVLLLFYIALGKQALRDDLSSDQRRHWGLTALACVGAIVALALTRWPGSSA